MRRMMGTWSKMVRKIVELTKERKDGRDIKVMKSKVATFAG